MKPLHSTRRLVYDGPRQTWTPREHVKEQNRTGHVATSAIFSRCKGPHLTRTVIRRACLVIRVFWSQSPARVEHHRAESDVARRQHHMLHVGVLRAACETRQQDEHGRVVRQRVAELVAHAALQGVVQRHRAIVRRNHYLTVVVHLRRMMATEKRGSRHLGHTQQAREGPRRFGAVPVAWSDTRQRGLSPHADWSCPLRDGTAASATGTDAAPALRAAQHSVTQRRLAIYLPEAWATCRWHPSVWLSSPQQLRNLHRSRAAVGRLRRASTTPPSRDEGRVEPDHFVEGRVGEQQLRLSPRRGCGEVEVGDGGDGGNCSPDHAGACNGEQQHRVCSAPQPPSSVRRL